MGNAESRLMNAWASEEYVFQADDLSFVDDIGDDPAPIDSAAFFGLKSKKSHVDKCRARQIDIKAKIFHLTGEEIDIETNTVFGRRTEKEFVFRPKRTPEEHAAKVAEMAKRGYAFRKEGEETNREFNSRELSDVRRIILGIINTEQPLTYNKRDRHVTG